MNKRISLIENLIFIIGIIVYSYLVFIGNNRFIYQMDYFKCLIYLLSICLICFIVGLIQNDEKTYQRNINYYIILYFLFLISVTFFIGRTDIKLYSWWYSVQTKPFHMIIRQLKHASFHSILNNVMGNTIMVIPLSFLLMIKDKKYYSVIKQFKIVFLTIILIEVLQAFTHTGSFDVDDIILNYLGTFIFTIILVKTKLINFFRKLFFGVLKIKKN